MAYLENQLAIDAGARCALECGRCSDAWLGEPGVSMMAACVRVCQVLRGPLPGRRLLPQLGRCASCSVERMPNNTNCDNTEEVLRDSH